MVRHAFRVLTNDKIKTRLIAFSDDHGWLRKVPDNVPNKEMMEKHLGKPLTQVPDPFGTHSSFRRAQQCTATRLSRPVRFDYEFLSSTDCYTSGRLDEALLKRLAPFEEVMEVMLPSLREERAQTYSPFLPIDEKNRDRSCSAGRRTRCRGGNNHLRRRRRARHDARHRRALQAAMEADWAMRWVALGVDYEMAGKDFDRLGPSCRAKICRALGGAPPEGFNYELFLDENGQKISKSKGNGLTIDEWLRYASPESLSLFMYREPKAAKRLYFDVIPRHGRRLHAISRRLSAAGAQGTARQSGLAYP